MLAQPVACPAWRPQHHLLAPPVACPPLSLLAPPVACPPLSLLAPPVTCRPLRPQYHLLAEPASCPLWIQLALQFVHPVACLLAIFGVYCGTFAAIKSRLLQLVVCTLKRRSTTRALPSHYIYIYIYIYIISHAIALYIVMDEINDPSVCTASSTTTPIQSHPFFAASWWQSNTVIVGRPSFTFASFPGDCVRGFCEHLCFPAPNFFILSNRTSFGSPQDAHVHRMTTLARISWLSRSIHLQPQ